MPLAREDFKIISKEIPSPSLSIVKIKIQTIEEGRWFEGSKVKIFHEEIEDEEALRFLAAQAYTYSNLKWEREKSLAHPTWPLFSSKTPPKGKVQAAR